MNVIQSFWSRNSIVGAMAVGLMGLGGLTGCPSSDFPVLANVVVEPGAWTASTDSVALSLSVDVTGIDNPVSAVSAEGMDQHFTLSKAGDLDTGGEHWTTTATLTGPFTAGTYNFVFTATDSEGDVVTDDEGETVVISAD